MIQVENLTKFYGPTPAIQDLNFHAERGEILGFLGPNGAGKTTAMRILTGYMPPTSGSAVIAGFSILEESLEARRRIGYLPETVPLYPELTVVEYLSYMGSLRSVSSIEARIPEVIAQVQLEDRSNHFIGSLSKGLRQRVGLAQALLHEPQVLILDEPTIGLDPAQIREVRELIQSIGEDRTVLLSTHILSEAQQICDRVLIINKGRIVAEDSPENLQAQLRGGDRLTLDLVGDVQAAMRILRDLDGVTSTMKGERDGQIVVTMVAQADPRAAISRVLVEAGFDLLEMRSAGFSLEEVFLQLTRERSEESDA
jgi:ABC-2 type transport system ATP-binding protein